MIVVLFQKRRGVNVKAKHRLLEIGVIMLVMILDAYLFGEYTQVNKNEYNIAIDRSTANYIEIETKEDIYGEIVVNSILPEKEEVKNIEPIVYDGKTLNELAELINKSLNSTISGKGYLIASHSLEMGVDPIMATAIMLHETGCKWGCSRLVTECNNVGGQKGYGCGSYSYFNTLDEGIIAFIDNLSINYINYGLITPEQINHKYAEDPNWSVNVNKYIEIIKAQ